MGFGVQNLVAIAIGLGIGLIAIRVLGVPAWLIAIVSLPVLVFWHHALGAFVAALTALVRWIRPGGVDESSGIARFLSWLVSVEGVRDGRGGWLDPKPAVAAIRKPPVPKQHAAKDDSPVYRSTSAERFERMSEPAVFLIRERADFVRSRSRLGGFPALPAGVTWPRGRTYPLHFLAEIHLDEVPIPPAPDALPRSGVLFFFVDLSTDGDLEGRVLYAAQHGPDRVSPPEDTPGLDHVADAERGKITLTEIPLRPLTLPLLNPAAIEGFDHQVADSLHHHAIKRHREAILAETENGKPVLHPPRETYIYSMIGGPKLNVANGTDGEGVKLLQIDSDLGLGMQIGDMGVLEFWISENDLHEGRWERAFATASSC